MARPEDMTMRNSSMRVLVSLSALLLFACVQQPPSPAAVRSSETAAQENENARAPDATAKTESPPAPAPICAGDERLFGTTCCRTERDGPVGHTICRGPNVGAPCKRKGDCDVMCGCDDPQLRPPMQGNSPGGPPDGTTGWTGQCMGQIVDGAWYCVIDEKGVVTHFIRN